MAINPSQDQPIISSDRDSPITFNSPSNQAHLNELLSRPKPPKKKTSNHRKKMNKTDQNNKKIDTKALESFHSDAEIDDDDLIEQILEKTNQIDLVDQSEQAINQSNSDKFIHSDNNVNHSSRSSTMQIPKKKNRQKERLARRQATQDQSRQVAQLELSHQGPLVDQRKIESDELSKACRKLGLEIVEITPDGHCLFSAIADQLNLHSYPNGPYTYQTCRTLASDYIRQRRDEFIPYLTDDDNSCQEGLMTANEFEKHCDRLRDTASWGGEPEILALSKCLKFPIHIIQAFQPVLKISHDEFFNHRKGKALMISYHKKSYGLGEHYNSLRPIQK
ncbi:hypothetical protein O181_058562 [Austropuccinia psidii MF-1]|uniref:OTU domain-containing protein n=1 Tax=Austropuccinia psidii MF-1 TaxID=1389203 RepID=A0A9Q3HWJ4_9BASI|nr:hypothetical protein [Austropuccinia psidii MF-1]